MNTRYRVQMSHPDEAVHIYDTRDPDESIVVVCPNADAADAWIQDHTEPEPTVEQLIGALVDPDRRGDWFQAGADACGPTLSASHHAMSNAAHMLTAMMFESGFPLQTFLSILRNQMVEIDNQAKERLRAEGTIGRLGAWRDDA